MSDKLGCAFPMVISSDSRVGQHRDEDHEENAPFTWVQSELWIWLFNLKSKFDVIEISVPYLSNR